jgi:hypothetical protein
VIFSVSRDIADLLVGPEQKPAPAEEIKQVTGILNDLSRGRLDRALFTANANFYFSSLALQDYSKSLKNLGKLKSVSRVRESARGGMLHRSYKAAFQKKSVNLNIYVMPDGKYEQFLVEESF